MNKDEYMKILPRELRRLPKEDYYKAIEYYNEYFDEAGPENEQQAIADLGAPEDAAKEILMSLAQKAADEPPKSVKRGLSAVWIGILGICAAPIALPLAAALIILVAALVLTIVIVLLALAASAVSVAAAGIIGIIGGIILVFSYFADGLCNIGAGIFSLGIGILFTYGSILLFKWTMKKITVFLGHIAKGGRKYETDK